MAEDKELKVEERTFSQAELDSIVQNRLAEEKKKFADYDDLKAKAAKFDEAEEASKTELQKATERAEGLQKELDQLKAANEINQIRAKVSKETGVPAELLTGTDEESCKANAEAILKFAKPNNYPSPKPNTNAANSDDDSMREFARQVFKKG